MMDVLDKVAAKWVKAVSPAKRNRSTMLPEDVDLKPKDGRNLIASDDVGNGVSSLGRIGKAGRYMTSRNNLTNRTFTERGRYYRRTRMRRRCA
ncbi:hypothetical protein RCC89_16795 [Cytophagaceae bacterium ABcell3]|nr:hypothetical protein RCC89_16795 [Cytophagaceae bacterium ABcell3]